MIRPLSRIFCHGSILVNHVRWISRKPPSGHLSTERRDCSHEQVFSNHVMVSGTISKSSNAKQFNKKNEKIGRKPDGHKREENDFLHSLVNTSNSSSDCVDPIELDNKMSNWIKTADLNDRSNLANAFETLDIIYISKIRRSQFVNTLRTKLFQQLDNLDIDGVKKLLFAIILSKKKLTIAEQSRLEAKIMDHLPTMSMNETSLFTAAIFKSQSQLINEDIVTMIINKLKNNLANSDVHQVAYSSIFKFLRTYATLPNFDAIKALIKSLDADTLARFDLLPLVHLNFFSSYYDHNNKLISEVLIDKCSRDPSTRLKDIAHAFRIAYDMNIDISDDIIDTLVEKVLSSPENYSNEKFLYHTINFLTLAIVHGKCPTALIEQVIKMKKWTSIPVDDGHIDLSEQWLKLNTVMKFYFPQFELFTEEEMYLLSKKVSYSDVSKNLPKDSSSFDECFNKLYQGVNYIIRPPSRILVKRVLPESFHPDIILAMDNRTLNKITWTLNRFVLEPNYFNGCLLINLKHKAQFCDQEEKLLRGIYRIRSLLYQKLGFSIVDIDWKEFNTGKDAQSIGNMIKNTIKTSIDDKLIDEKFSVLIRQGIKLT